MKRLSSLVLLLGVLPSAALAQHPMDDRGFNSGRVYSFHGIDSVNQFNGNLNVSIPIGPAMKVSDRLSYQLAVYYNSHVWTYDTTINGDPWARQLRFNAGLGWHLSLGKLYFNGDPDQYIMYSNGWTYVSPDGGVHTFGSGDLTYSNDGTHIRLRKVSDTECHLDFPDGTVHVFHKLARVVPPQTGAWLPSAAQSAGWYLSQIKEPTSTYITNTVHIQYSTTSAHKELWQITDSNNRQITVAFKNSPISNLSTELDYVDLPSYLDQVVRYSFTYAEFYVPPPFADRAYPIGAQIPTRVLTAVTPVTPAAPQTPIAAGYSMTVGGLPAYDTTREASGALKRLVLPTLGSIGWEHFVRGFNDATNRAPVEVPVVVTKRYECDPATSGTCAADQSPTWTYGATFGGRPGCPVLCADGVTYPCYSGRARLLMTWLKEPAGAFSEPRTTVNYFNTYQFLNDPDGDTCPANGFIDGELGLPFTRFAADGEGRFLSTEMRHGFRDADLTNWSGQGALPDADNRIRERSYVKYEYEIPSGNSPFRWNPRVQSAATHYPQDTGCNGICVRRTDHFNYTGYGHYRRTSSNDNFGGTGNFRTTFTNYQPSTGTSWILGLHSEQCVADETQYRSAAAEVSNCAGLQSPNVTRLNFNPSTGLLLARRVLKGPGTALSRMDFLTVFGYDGNGTLTSEQSYGGDTNLLPAFQGSYLDPEVFTPSGEARYQVTHTPTYASYTSAITRMQSSYANGVVARDETYDRWTGLVKASRDGAGLDTLYDYDLLGRIESMTLPDTTLTSYSYVDATSSSNARVHATINVGTDSQSVGNIEKVYAFDGLGRLRRESTRTGAAAWSTVQTDYDVLGRKSAVSTPVGGSSYPTGNVGSYWTQFTYDIFGRELSIVAPDHTAQTYSKTTFEYLGTRVRTREQRISTNSTASVETTIATTETYDAQGRLISVTEPAGSTDVDHRSGANVITRYAYDSAGRLAKVNTDGSSQERRFEYDGRGVLIKETHPENGIVEYGDYDARGHARLKLQGGANSIFDLKYTYDGAERLMTVSGRNPNHVPGSTHADLTEFRILKSFEYWDNSAPVGSRGRLHYATRYNHPPDPSSSHQYLNSHIYRIREQFLYDSKGMTSDKNTTVFLATSLATPPESWPIVREIQQAFTYNKLGLPKTVRYPLCVGCGLPSEEPARELAPTYSYGQLSSIPGFVTGLSYWPNGLRNTVQHSNGIVDVQTPDTTGMARPLSFTSSTYTLCNPPVLGQLSGGTRNGSNPPAVTLTAPDIGGTTPRTYQWYRVEPNAGDIAGATSQTYQASPNVTTKYFVRVTNACRTVYSNIAVVSVDECLPPASLVSYVRFTADGQISLQATAIGSETMTYEWRGSNASNSDFHVFTGPSTIIAPAALPTSYYVKVTNTCQTASVQSAASMAQHPSDPSPGPTLTATWASNAVTLTWSAVSGASTYAIERRSAGSGFVNVAYVTAPTTQYVDTDIVASRTYAYRVKENSASQGFSNVDAATTMTFTSISAGLPIRAVYFDELLAGVNAVRAASGWAPVSWGHVLPLNVPAPAIGGSIRAAYLHAIRERLNEALHALGVSVGPYADPNLTNLPIKAEYLTNLQGRIQ